VESLLNCTYVLPWQRFVFCLYVAVSMFVCKCVCLVLIVVKVVVALFSRQLIGPADWVFVTLGPLHRD